jgi:hypothetical protein
MYVRLLSGNCLALSVSLFRFKKGHLQVSHFAFARELQININIYWPDSKLRETVASPGLTRIDILNKSYLFS